MALGGRKDVKQARVKPIHVKEMPPMIRRFVFSFSTTFLILFLAACFSQALFQFGILPRAIGERQIATQVGRQSRRVLNILGDVLIMELYPQYEAQLMADLKKNDATWEQVQDAALHGNAQLGIDPAQFPPDVQKQIQGSQASFLTLKAAINQIEAHPPKRGDNLDLTLRTLIQTGTPYETIFQNVYNELSADADQQVYAIQHYELLLFALQILTLLAEALLVIRPAIQTLARAFKRIEEIATRSQAPPAQREPPVKRASLLPESRPRKTAFLPQVDEPDSPPDP
jgi:hypothetical protein